MRANDVRAAPAVPAAGRLAGPRSGIASHALAARTLCVAVILMGPPPCLRQVALAASAPAPSTPAGGRPPRPPAEPCVAGLPEVAGSLILRDGILRLAPDVSAGEAVATEARLAGLAVSAGAGTGATWAAEAGAWIAQGPFRLQAAGPPDRWGRQPLLASRGSDLLNLGLVRAGLDLFRSGEVSYGCARAFQAAEEEARRARTGIWGEEAAVLAADDGPALLSRIGRFSLVEGRVGGLGETKARVYLNFGTVRGQDFAVFIEKRNLRKFEASGMRWTSWEGRRIRVRGVVVQAGGPLIEVSSPEDVERLD